MDAFQIIWDNPEDPDGNVEHIAEHGLTIEDVEYVLAHPESEGISKSTGLPVLWGHTIDEIHIIVVYEPVDKDTVRVITAYEVSEP